MKDSADLCLHELFEEQARRTPDAPALEDARISLTYSELDTLADRLASYLGSRGIGPDEPVGVYMERRAEYVVACLAAMKAGGAYLILELAYPPPLLADVVADASPRIVLTQERYVERLPEGTETFVLDEGWEEGLEDVPAGDGRPEVDQDNLAFISYSAGTTGKPKGIANPHRAPVLSYLWRFGISDYAPGDRVGCNVFFIWEMMRPLLRGATTVVIPDDVIYDPKALIRFLEEYGITETLFTPSLLEAVLNSSGPDVGERLSKLRTLWLNGEVVTRTLARRAMELLPDARLLNVYSCSETHEVAAGDLRELVENPESTYCAVGVPMDPEHLYLLDAEGEQRARRRGRRALRRRRLPGPRLRRTAREDRGELPGRSLLLEERRKDVSLGRQGPHPLRREPGDPRPRGLHGQDPGLQRRARRRRGRHREGSRRKVLRRGL